MKGDAEVIDKCAAEFLNDRAAEVIDGSAADPPMIGAADPSMTALPLQPMNPAPDPALIHFWMTIPIPPQLRSACHRTAQRREWLEQLPAALEDVRRRWVLTLGAPFIHASCAWVAPAERADGSSAVLKLGMPHMEGEQEADGLRFWKGDPTIRLLEHDSTLNAMLLERCMPGSPLSTQPEPEQDTVISSLLRRLWRAPSATDQFRPLSLMLETWAEEIRMRIRRTAGGSRCSDAGLIREGLRLFDELPRTTAEHVVLATDLHAGNVLRAEREPWLVIDPKPFVGDPAYDATQHLLNCGQRLLSDPEGTIRRFSDLLQVDYDRVRLWTFARAAADSQWSWPGPAAADRARRLAPL